MSGLPRPGRGRPRKAEHERRTGIITVRVSPVEMDAAYRYAMRLGEPLHVILRTVLLRMVRRELWVADNSPAGVEPSP